MIDFALMDLIELWKRAQRRDIKIPSEWKSSHIISWVCSILWHWQRVRSIIQHCWPSSRNMPNAYRCIHSTNFIHHRAFNLFWNLLTTRLLLQNILIWISCGIHNIAFRAIMISLLLIISHLTILSTATFSMSVTLCLMHKTLIQLRCQIKVF